MPTSPSPASRRAARETALRVLYMIEVGKPPIDEALEETIRSHGLEEDAAAFARRLVEGTLERRQALDEAIRRYAIGFPPERQTVVDRTILRLAAGEILHGLSDAPFGVAANEAVELAKKYSTADAGRFINGILGAMIRDAEARKEETSVA